MRTLGDTVAWVATRADAGTGAVQRLLAEAAQVELADDRTPPPRAGRNGSNLNAAFDDRGAGVWTQAPLPSTPVNSHLLYFVVSLRNRLQVPLTAARFYLVLEDTQGTQAALPWPERSYLLCDDDNFAGAAIALAPGATGNLLCEARIAGVEAFAPEVFGHILAQVRAGSLQPVAWFRELSLKVSGYRDYDGFSLIDHGVDAEHGHPPSANVHAGLVRRASQANGPPRRPVRQTSCEQRADCLKIRLAPLEGVIGLLLVLLGGALPGAIVAGLVRAICPDREARATALRLLVVLSVIALPVGYAHGGGGWGPLAAIMLLGYVEIGFWLGMFVAGWVLGRPAAPLVDTPA